ncbi:MAG: molybdopterin-synthase adenylyltransferase MoeB [Elusimicrobiota bacterium]|nr:molybdopterin-synthase adenylyltransferase MoeB [Elusimicrobiota bacterium]
MTDISIDKNQDLTKEEILRYGRHLILPEINVAGQKKLKNAKVLIVGAGGLGSPLCLYLAAAGIGTLGIVDYDFVEESNLQRQVIHSTKNIGRTKTDSAKDAIKALNPFVNVVTYSTALKKENAMQIIRGYDIVADGTDNFKTRYLINDACVLLGIPNVYGSIFQFEGQASVFYAKKGPCYRCLLPSPPPVEVVPSCSQGGVFGVLPGIIGNIEANEIIKIIAGIGNPLIGILLLFNSLEMKFSELKIEKNPDCPICGKNPSIKELIDYNEFCGLKKDEKNIFEITAQELKNRMDANDPLQIIDIRPVNELSIFKFPRAKNIPFEEILTRKNELNENIDVVLICRTGQKSIFAINILQGAGYKGKIFSLESGINSWAEIDKNAPIY